jgi:hypothetical protein
VKEETTMHLRPSGIFDVTPSEKIKFTVTRKDSQNKAAFGQRDFAGGAQVQPDPDLQTKVWAGSVPATDNAQCTMTIVLDFTGNIPGTFDPEDKYFIEIDGESGAPVNDSVNAGPLIRERFYTFEVSP